MPMFIVLFIRHFDLQRRSAGALLPVEDSALDRRIRCALVFGFATLGIGAIVARSLGLIR